MSSLGETQLLVKTKCDVEVLNGLPCRSLHEVVNARNDDDLPAGAVDAPADVAEVRVRDVLDLGELAAGQPDERRRPVGLGENGSDRIGVDTRARWTSGSAGIQRSTRSDENAGRLIPA